MSDQNMLAQAAAMEKANVFSYQENKNEVNESETTVNVQPSSSSSVQNDEDDEAVIYGADQTDFSPMVDSNIPSQTQTKSYTFTEDELRAEMPQVSQEYFDEIKGKTIIQIDQYKKNLIIEYGMTPEEAHEAALNKMKKDAVKLEKEWLQKNPAVAIVEINKEDVSKINFTDEEQAKLTHAKVIKLREIENIALETINIIPKDKRIKSRLLSRMHGSICKDSIPLIRLCDYVTFSGAQIAELYSVVDLNNDDTIYERTSKAASFIYKKLIGGSHYKKYDDDKNIILSYEDFLKTFPYMDMNMSLFSILCATSTEKTTSHFGCARCRTDIAKVYNIRDLITFDTCPDEIKQLIDTIIVRRAEGDYLKSLQNPLLNSAMRFKSPITNNIYEIQYPSIAKALLYIPLLEQNSTTDNYLEQAIYLDNILYINTVYLYDKEDDGYVEYTDCMEKEPDELKPEDTEEFWDIVSHLPQEDIDIIRQLAKKDNPDYEPSYEMDIDCTNPKCEHHMHNVFQITDLLFRKAQDSPERIKISED